MEFEAKLTLQRKTSTLTPSAYWRFLTLISNALAIEEKLVVQGN